jgi:hypothetical protein
MPSPSRMARFVTAATLAFLLASSSGCRVSSKSAGHPDATPRRPIEDVQRDHTPALMAIPGVVGVYQGALDDGTPFIGVMVLEKTAEITRRVPEDLEGYRVKIDVTGPIKPLSPGGK